MSRLSARQRAAIMHLRTQRWSIAQIAEEIGCTPSQIGYAVSKGWISKLEARPRTRWQAEPEAELRRRWDAGQPTELIGRALGVSKNAVIGKAHRLGLEPRPSPIKPRRPVERMAKDATPAAPGEAKAPAAKPPKPGKGDPSRLARVPRTNQDPCQWIEGEPSADDKCKCGARAVAGRPYCLEHCAKAYITRPGVAA